jgi:hypothetical protein
VTGASLGLIGGFLCGWNSYFFVRLLILTENLMEACMSYRIIQNRDLDSLIGCWTFDQIHRRFQDQQDRQETFKSC